MGGGVGGGVGIDSEPSPRRAAIEKAQAELRQEFVVREERRRELEFLEKGGNPLDFKFGETTTVGFQCPSPTDPLAEQKYLTSEAKGRFALNASPNGDSAASNERPAILLGRGLNTTDNLVLFAGDIEAIENERVMCSCDGEGNVVQEGQTSQLDGNQIELHVKELEDSGGVRLGVRGQAYTRRNRYKSTRNHGHSSLRDTVKVSAGDRSPTLSNSIKGHGDAKDTDIETHTDKNGNVSSVNISNSTSLDRNGMPEALIYKNNLGTDSEIPKKDDISAEVANIYIEGNRPGARTAASSEQEQSQQLPRETDIEKGAVSTILMTAMAVREGENQPLHPGNDRVNRSKPGQNIMIADHNLNQGHADSVNEREKSLKVELESSHKQYFTTTVDVGKLTASETNSAHFQRRHAFHENAANEETSTSNHKLESTSLDNVKETTGSNYTDLHSRRRANYISEDKLLGNADAKIMVEEGLPDGRLRQAEVPMITNIQDIKLKGLSRSLQEKKIDGESGSIISSEKGTTHPQSRGPSPSGVPSNKNPGVAILSEKEKDSAAIAEMERQKANLSAAVKKAHEDLFLEEAKAIKVTQKKSAEWSKAKPFLEPPRRKSHWDFVLEEMAWMANDFMQERRWKMAAAAQVCRWVVQERGQTKFQERDPQWKQRKDAHVLANAVMKFWQLVEAQFCLGKHEASLEHGSSTSRLLKSVNEGAAVQREIGESNTTENKKLEAEMLGGVSCLPVQKYAIRFLKYTKTSDHLIQAEAPSTPERLSDAGILKPSWEDQFPEESLFYTTPCGAMEAYRNSVESYWASLEFNHEDLLQQDNTEAWTDTDAQAGTEASDEAMGLFKYGMCDFVDDTRSHSGLSPQERAFGGEEDELRVQYLPGAFEGSKATKFARKKRKSVTKASMPKTYGGRITLGESQGISLGNKTETNGGIPSPLLSGKRSFPSSNSNAGAIPIKRVRSSTVAARQRAAGSAYTGITGASSLATKTDASSGDTSSLQDEFSTLASGSQSRKAVDIDSAGTCGKHLHFDSADVSMKFKKKKKSKHFGTGISSTAMDTAGNSGPSGKGFEYEQKWPQDVMSPHEQREQSKRKIGSQIFSPSSVSGSAPELQMTNSQGFLGQPATKKSKLSKQLLDSCPEAATPAMVSTPSPVACQMSSTSNPNRFIRMIASRDRGRKNKTVKGTASQAGASIPWSTFEDQALVVLVHDWGPNWELVSDIINSSLQIKCIFRKPEDCKERHKSITERTIGDGGDSPEDSGSPQPYPSTLHGIPKGNARLLLQRLQGPMEEETLKAHFERIVQIGGRQHSQKVQNDNEEQKQRAAVHPSHSLAISQICSNSLTGGFLTPLDLCDQTPSNTEMQPNAYQFQASQATALGMANSLGTVSAVQTTAGIPSLQGTSNLPLATGLGSSSAALNVAASSRDVQRFAPGRPMSVSMDEQRLQQYNQMVAGRSLQPAGIAVSVGLPTGIPSSNDRGVLMLNAGNAAGMVSGLSRGMPLPRPGFPGIGSPGILSMVSSGISNMRPSSGIGLPAAGTVTSGAITGPGNMIPRSRESLQMLRSTQSPEDQRQMLMQELQLQAAQGNGQATTSFGNLNGAFSNQMVSSPPTQNFPVQHQQHQVPPGHNNLHHSQLQNPNHNQQQQAYMLHLAKERQLQHQQHQRLLQQQQQFPAPGSQLPQSQSHPLSQTQHTMSSLPNVPHQPHQQHSLPQHKLPQQQTTVQQQSTSQSPPTLQHQPPQQSAPSPLNPSLVQNSQKQQSSLPQTPGQSSQVIGQSNLPQQNQIPKQQQQQQRQQQLQQQQKHQTQPQQQQKHPAQAQQLQQVKVSKGLGRGSMIMQNMPSEPIQANGLQGSVPGNQLSEKGELGHLVSCQRIFPGPASLQSGKQMTQSGVAGPQGQGSGQASVSLSQTSNLSQQQKGFLQQPSSKLQTQVLLSTESHQVSVPSPTTAQQQQQLPACQQQASSIPIPPLASSSQLQQRQPMQPQQAVQRRLPQRLTGSDVGLQTPLQLGKNCMQQDQVTSQLPSQPGHATFQVGSNIGNPLSTVSASPGVPLVSVINSNTTGVHSAQWKPGQNIPQKTGAPYNLSSNSSASNTQISPVVSSSGMTITSSNGNAAVSTPTTTGITSHGVSVAGLPQRQYAVPVGSVHGQSVGGHLAIGPRPAQRMGAQWQPQQAESQQQQRQVHNGMQISTTTSLGNSYIGPPTSGPT